MSPASVGEFGHAAGYPAALESVFLNQLKEKATVRAAPLQEGREALAALDVTDDLKSVLDTSFELAEKAIAAFGAIPDEPEGIFMAYRAIRYAPYAMEMLYPAVRESEGEPVFLRRGHAGSAARTPTVCVAA